MDPLTGSVLVTVFSCQLGKGPVSESCELSASLPLVSHHVQASLFLFMSLISTVTVHAAQRERKSFFPSLVVCTTPIQRCFAAQSEPSILRVNWDLFFLALMVNDSTCPLQQDTRCFNPCLQGDWPTPIGPTDHLTSKIGPPNPLYAMKCVRK